LARNHAAVIGGSIAGMSAARALCDTFDTVTILEQDELPDTAEARRGTPQAWHNHLLLDRGREALDALFPGYTDYCISQGGVLIDPGYDAAQFFPDGWSPRKRSDARTLFASRPKLEACIRDFVRKDSRITFIENVRGTGLMTSSSNGRVQVTGLTYRDGQAGKVRELPADFVVDATGRGSKSVSWMKDLGIEVEECNLDAQVTYTSRWYRSRADHDEWWKWLVIYPAADREAELEHQYICTIFPIEDECFIAIMGSWGLPMPQTNEEFEAAYRRARGNEFARVLDLSEPLTDMRRSKSTRNVWRRFDKIASPPARFVAVGDAVCAFNPIYGQGMTCAAANGVILRDVLCDHAPESVSLVREFYSRQAELLQAPWQLAMTRDGAFPHAAGTETYPDGLKKSLVEKYTWTGFQFINEAAFADKVVKTHYERAFNLHDTLGDFLRNPRVLFGLARYGVQKACGRGVLRGQMPAA
jgi:2-polyprenyl-6-methoxyphenol hydroxylase-like FAD-dependent oxidoreductase